MNSIQPSVLIVVLNYGTYELTLEMIQRVKKTLDYDNYSIMVIDNCSPNESAEVLQNNSKNFGYIFYANKTNSGYAAGNNIGIRYGVQNGFDYSWVLNNDVIIKEPNILSRMIEIAESDDRIASIGPKVFASDGNAVAPFCNRPTFWSLTFGVKTERDKRRQNISVAGEVYCIYGCCVLLKNKSMKDIDYMDERTFLYGEEFILAERQIAKGYTSYYLPDVSVIHNEGTSTKKMSTNKLKLRIRENVRSRELYFKEYRNYSLPARCIYHICRALIIIARNR